VRHRGGEALAHPHDGLDQRIERILAPDMRRDRVKRRAVVCSCHQVQQVGPQPPPGQVVDLAEPRRHAGLERKPPQKRGAEGVDGLDLQPARRLDRLGKERPGPAAQTRR
jgi:hypothetical protein